jgi:hypothetical protein
MMRGSVDASVTEKTAAPLFTVQLYQKYDFKLQQSFVLDNSLSLNP